jgi:hypothetical protein
MNDQTRPGRGEGGGDSQWMHDDVHLLRPAGAIVQSRPHSTSCAASPLHSWLQPGAPSGGGAMT